MLGMEVAVLSYVLAAPVDVQLLDFSRPGCGPCMAMAPVVEGLIRAGYPIRPVDTSREPQIASQFGVDRVPCLIMLSGGREVGRTLGPQSANDIRQMFHAAGFALPSEAPAPRGSLSGLLRKRRGPDRIPPPPTHYGRRGSGANAGSGAGGDAGTAGEGSASAATLGVKDFPDELVAQLMAATVRLKIDDPRGNSVGSGTIVHYENGEALILTCGHLFRDSGRKPTMVADIFWPKEAQGVPAELIDCDLEADVALVRFKPPFEVAVSQIAAVDYAVLPGQPSLNVGCNHGEIPTSRRSPIKSINRFLGPANLQTYGQPVEGRSGGGLFSQSGQVIGVCNARNPEDREGLYAALPVIHALLARNHLSGVAGGAGGADSDMAADTVSGMDNLAQNQEPDARLSGMSAANTPAPPVNPFRGGQGAIASRTPAANTAPRGIIGQRGQRGQLGQQPDAVAGQSAASMASADSAATAAASNPTGPADRALADSSSEERAAPETQLSAQELATLAELQEKAQDAEVICIIRPLDDPNAKTQIIVLDRASRALLEELAQHSAARHFQPTTPVYTADRGHGRPGTAPSDLSLKPVSPFYWLRPVAN